MTDVKPTLTSRRRAANVAVRGMKRRQDSDTMALLRMADQLGPRDRAMLSQIIRRAGEICERDGEETALAVLDQIEAILRGRRADA